MDNKVKPCEKKSLCEQSCAVSKPTRIMGERSQYALDVILWNSFNLHTLDFFQALNYFNHRRELNRIARNDLLQIAQIVFCHQETDILRSSQIVVRYGSTV